MWLYHRNVLLNPQIQLGNKTGDWMPPSWHNRAEFFQDGFCYGCRILQLCGGSTVMCKLCWVQELQKLSLPAHLLVSEQHRHQHTRVQASGAKEWCHHLDRNSFLWLTGHFSLPSQPLHFPRYKPAMIIFQYVNMNQHSERNGFWIHSYAQHFWVCITFA